jgi:hypothetical protein
MRKAFFAAMAVIVAAAGVAGVGLAARPRPASTVAIETGTNGFDVQGSDAAEVVVEYPEIRHVSLTISGANGLDYPEELIRVRTDVAGLIGTNNIADLEFSAATRVVYVEFDTSKWSIRGLNIGGSDLQVRYNYTVTYPAPM